MTPADLAALCAKLYGDHWQTKLARDLGRPRSTVNRWARGRSPIPKEVERWLVKKTEA